jgi:hypothetical protein
MKRSSISATQRTLKEMRRLGYRTAIVEKWNPHAFVRQDLYGIIDVLGIKARKILGIQSTTRANTGAHVHKLLEDNRQALSDWLDAGGLFELWSWAKVGAKGKRKHWEVARRTFTMDDLC